MVKRQREKQYNSAREHRAYAQIRSGGAVTSSLSQVQRRLPFSHCALSLLPYTNPVCTRTTASGGGGGGGGIIFENSAILPFVMKHKMDPVSGEPLTSRELITLNMDQDDEGRWQCPVLTKHLNDHTKIVAIIQPGGKEANVYSYEAYLELNVKHKHYEDLVSSAKFNRTTDVLILNDPENEEFNQKRDINNFYHILHGKRLGLLPVPTNTVEVSGNVHHSRTALRVLEQLQKDKDTANAMSATDKKSSPSSFIDPDETTNQKKLKVLASDVLLGVKYTTGRASTSLTSTVMEVNCDNESRQATPEELLQSQWQAMRKLKKKGYVRFCTTMGNLTLELHCDMAPRTCTNFLGLCREERYTGTVFHRLVPNFMIQGGKAINVGGGEDGSSKRNEDSSIWGRDFEDEFDDRLKHSGAGVVSMANSGKNTNRQQFFIAFKSCSHLDRKHSVFGTLIEGMEVLQAMEKIPTDKRDRPKQEIKILSTEILADPAKDAEELEQRRFEELAAARVGKKKAAPSQPAKTMSAAAFASSSSSAANDVVGCYLKDRLKSVAAASSLKAVTATSSSEVTAGSSTSVKDEAAETANEPPPSRLPQPPKKTTFGNFSGW